MALIVITIFCLCFVVAIFGWWTLLLIPLFIGAAILDGIIKDNDAQKRAEREREQAYRDRIENADFNIGFFNKEEFYKEILDSSAREILEDMTYSYFYKSLNLYLKGDQRLSIDARKDVSSFLSYGLSNYFLTYFKYDNYAKEDIKEKLKCFLNEESIKSIVEGYLNNI